jgi:hypothetical protein
MDALNLATTAEALVENRRLREVCNAAMSTLGEFEKGAAPSAYKRP